MYRALSGLVLLSFSLLACSTNKNLAEQHLQLLKSGKQAEAQQQYCSLGDNLRLIEVEDFQLISETNIDDNGIQYTYSVDSPEIENQVIIEVYRPDDFFNVAVRSNSQLNNLLKSSSELMGEVHTGIETPKREDYSSNEYCVFLPFEQFED
jgi:hypothetical protein